MGQVLTIFRALGLRNGRQALKQIKKLKNSGCTDIRFWGTIPDRRFGGWKRYPQCLIDFKNSSGQATVAMDFRNDRMWLHQNHSCISSVISSGKKLMTRMWNGLNEKLTSHITGTTFERRVSPNGEVAYFRQRNGQNTEKLFG